MEKLNGIDGINKHYMLNEDASLSESQNLTIMKEQGNIKLYFNEVGKYPLLSSEKQNELAKKAVLGDEEARNLLICSNLRLVVHLAYKFFYNKLDMEDLIEYGNMGLLTAISKYDPEKNVKFSTYASDWIISMMERAIVCTKKTVRIPVHLTYILYKLKKYELSYLDKYEKIPSNEELTEFFNKNEEKKISLETVNNLRIHFNDLIELNKSFVNTDEETDELLTQIKSDDILVEEEVISNIRNQNLYKILSGEIKTNLTPKERLVLSYRFGLNKENKELTLKAIGDILGVTKEWVRQLEVNALKKLNTEKIKTLLETERTNGLSH